MADYQILFQKADTIASGSSLQPGATQFQLTSGNFGTHTDYYVVDYDIPALAEVVELAVNGTTASVISRGRDATSQQPHTQGAKIGSMWTLSHQLRIQNAINALVPVSSQAYCSADVVIPAITSSPLNVPGCSINQTVSQAGTFFVTANADFEVFPGTNSNIIMTSSVILDGTSLRGQLVFQGSSPASQQETSRATLSKTWVIPAVVSSTAHNFILQVVRLSGSGSSLIHQDHTSITVTYTPTVVL